MATAAPLDVTEAGHIRLGVPSSWSPPVAVGRQPAIEGGGRLPRRCSLAAPRHVVGRLAQAQVPALHGVDVVAEGAVHEDQPRIATRTDIGAPVGQDVIALDGLGGELLVVWRVG